MDRTATVTEEVAQIAEKIGWSDHAEFFHKAAQQWKNIQNDYPEIGERMGQIDA